MAKNDLPMIGGDFVELVEKMRTAQRAYFKSRDARDLRESKQLELLVDSMIGGWHREADKWMRWGSGHKTDEQQGQYKFTTE